MKATEEVRAITRIAKILDAMPKDAQLRALAFLAARALDVAQCDASEALYADAAEARESMVHKREEP